MSSSLSLLAAGLAALTVLTWAGVGRANGDGSGPSDGQPALDLIAGMPFDNTFKQLGAPTPPAGLFFSWTADQRRSFPADLGKLCAGFWTFIESAPQSRVLPASLADGDKAQLPMDLCLVGHMPTDWPEREARLKSATTILQRANQAGASLHLPVWLKR